MAESALASKQAAASLASSVTSKTTYGAAAGTTIMGLEMEEFGVICGIVIALITLLSNIYFQRQKQRLDILLAQSQLEKLAAAAVDKTQQELMEKMKEDFHQQFGYANKRAGNDRRKAQDPNYTGVERRKGSRRTGPTGDDEAAKELRQIFELTRNAAEKLEQFEQKRHYED